MPSNQWCTLTIGTFGIVRCYIHIGVGLRRCSFLRIWALPEPQGVKRATESGFTSFLFYGYKESIATYMKNIHEQECIGGQDKAHRRTDQR